MHPLRIDLHASQWVPICRRPLRPMDRTLCSPYRSSPHPFSIFQALANLQGVPVADVSRFRRIDLVQLPILSPTMRYISGTVVAEYEEFHNRRPFNFTFQFPLQGRSVDPLPSTVRSCPRGRRSTPR